MDMDRRFGNHSNAASFLRNHGDVVPLLAVEVHKSYPGVAESDVHYVMTRLGFHYTIITENHGRAFSLYNFNGKYIELIHEIVAQLGEAFPAPAPHRPLLRHRSTSSMTMTRFCRVNSWFRLSQHHTGA
ncbi:hypothetical protein JG688_00004947 [Phytophthora aleatoria]|uniref:Uncharacterized protein n=1 Tax=Phytophthora aleatoria TaxID=2496075 RepID=A0A8J5J093_9STRA|nr:hypothetical protein JG688_00004947 [Phytophthora aleatoria]